LIHNWNGHGKINNTQKKKGVESKHNTNYENTIYEKTLKYKHINYYK